MGVVKKGYRLSVIDPESIILGDIDLEGYDIDRLSLVAMEIKEYLPPEAIEDNPGTGDISMPEQEIQEEPLAIITEDEESPTIAASISPGVVRLVTVHVPETGEYKVKWIENGVFSEEKSYYTDDRADSIITATAMAAEAKRAGFNVEIRG